MGKNASEIRREIGRTRARLGDTVDAIAYKADVPARVRDSVDERVETVKGQIGGVVDGVIDTLSDATEKLGGASRSVADNLPDSADVQRAAGRGLRFAAEDPFRLVLGALALGVLAGLVVPRLGGSRG